MKPYVVVIFGASGSGKSTLLELLHAGGSQYSIHVKATDRARRQYDGIEINCVDRVEPSIYDYVYQTYGHRYGIQRSQIDAALATGKYHFIICNDIDVIRALKRDYGEVIRLVLHTFDAPREELTRIQKSRGIDDDEIDLRIAKTNALYRTYVENLDLFDAVIPNHFGEDTSALRSRMERVLLDLARDEQPGWTHDLLIRLELLATELAARDPGKSLREAVEPGYAFIVMAMPDDDPVAEDVHHAIKRACEIAGMRGERVDDIQFTGQITEKIQSSIRLAQVVVADLTHSRPNVYYEVGYADAHGKPLILLARRGSEIHFDLRGNKVLFYRNMIELQTLLTSAINGVTATRA